jgi:predicted transcriptional regulator
MNEPKTGERSTRLGDLEAAIMNVIWQLGEATVEEVRAALQPERQPAYTTVMTVMSRLAAKGVLAREKLGRAYVYRAAAEQSEVAGSMLSSLVQRLYSGSPARAIAHLIETEQEVDEEELERLESLIRERRQRGSP